MVTSARPGDRNDLARTGRFGRHLLERFGDVHLGDLGLLEGAVELAPRDDAALGQLAVVDAADGQAAEVGRGAEVADEGLGRRPRLELRGRDVIDDGLEEGVDVLAHHVLLGADPAGPRVGVEDGEVDLVLVGIEVQEQLLDLVHHLVDAGVGPVDLVDDQHHRKPGLECLAQHETGLRQRALGGVDQQQDPVDHVQPPLDLAPEVGVARCVDDVHLDAAPAHGRVLGQDGDALFTLEVPRVHDAIGHLLVGAERAGLAQKGVDQGCLAVVNVGHDGHVANVISSLHGGDNDRRGQWGLMPQPRIHAPGPRAGPRYGPRWPRPGRG